MTILMILIAPPRALAKKSLSSGVAVGEDTPAHMGQDQHRQATHQKGGIGKKGKKNLWRKEDKDIRLLVKRENLISRSGH